MVEWPPKHHISILLSSKSSSVSLLIHIVAMDQVVTVVQNPANKWSFYLTYIDLCYHHGDLTKVFKAWFIAHLKFRRSWYFIACAAVMAFSFVIPECTIILICGVGVGLSGVHQLGVSCIAHRCEMIKGCEALIVTVSLVCRCWVVRSCCGCRWQVMNVRVVRIPECECSC